MTLFLLQGWQRERNSSWALISACETYSPECDWPVVTPLRHGQLRKKKSCELLQGGFFDIRDPQNIAGELFSFNMLTAKGLACIHLIEVLVLRACMPGIPAVIQFCIKIYSSRLIYENGSNVLHSYPAHWIKRGKKKKINFKQKEKASERGHAVVPISEVEL